MNYFQPFKKRCILIAISKAFRFNLKLLIFENGKPQTSLSIIFFSEIYVASFR